MLKIENVSKLFNPSTIDEKVALLNANLHLKEGDFVTIIGSNGAGKSTLMNIISGGLRQDLGDVFISGTNVSHYNEHQRSKWIGRVFQDPMAGTAPRMTIEENLAIAYKRGMKRGISFGVTSHTKKIFKDELSKLGIGLENRMSTQVGLLSGGERQALSLLMATFTKPKILLLDEHTAALDPARADLVTELTEKIVKDLNLTTLMVTHNMEQAIKLGNRLIMMDKGQIILQVDEARKPDLTVSKLLGEFEQISGKALSDDRVVLG